MVVSDRETAGNGGRTRTGTSVLTVQQLSEYLQVSEGHVYALARSGRIPAIRLGRQWRFRRDQIDQWLDELALRNAAVGQ